MNPENEKETAEGATSAASESQNPTGEMKPEDPPTSVGETGDEGKPGDGGASAAPTPAPEQSFGEGESLAKVMDAPVRTISKDIVEVPVEELKPHPLNESIYGHDVDDAFIQAIDRNGIYQPLLITSDKTIIAGHRRHAAAKQLNLKMVPTVLFHSVDELEIKQALVEANQQRVKTPEQIGREFNVLAEVEAERSQHRMEKGVKAVTQGEKGKTRDIVAAKLGKISGLSAERAGAVVEVIDKLYGGDEKSKKKAGKLRDLLNKNITGAYDKAVEDGHIKKAGKPARPKVKPEKKGSTESKSSDMSPAPKPAAGGTEEYDKALQGLYDAEAFLLNRASAKLSQAQKDEWQKVVQNVVKMLATIGVSIRFK